MPAEASSKCASWDIFCKVVDNYGDIGICWRLALQLACEHDVAVRLWVDNLESFACICPGVSTDLVEQRIGPVEIRYWTSPIPRVEVADVVIEAFACELPDAYLNAMSQRKLPPVWINLEYLSAEAWVEDCHLLTSVQSRSSLKKFFFFPGVTTKTGGLLREKSLLADRLAFDSAAAESYWRELKITPIRSHTSVLDGADFNKWDSLNSNDILPIAQSNNELLVSMFCYDNPALLELLQYWADCQSSVRVLAAPGPATNQIADWIGKSIAPGIEVRRNSLTVNALPFLSQANYDRLLWACDVNFVRGEDSFVRAQWAQRPFVWQIYPQTENAHFAKLDAFLARYLKNFEESDVVSRCWHAWNGIGEIGPAWRDFAAKRTQIQRHGKVWVSELDRAGNLADNLVRFVCGS